MRIFGHEVEVKQQDLDMDNLEFCPGEGVIIPILLGATSELEDFLISINYAGSEHEFKSLYIYVVEENKAALLCAEYEDGEVEVIHPIEFDEDLPPFCLT